MSVRKALSWCIVLVALVAAGRPAAAQDFRGRLNGTVTDNTGAVLPGVTVTVSSPALIQPQVQVTSTEGDFRFIALPPGVYEVAFELAGFQSLKREGVPCGGVRSIADALSDPQIAAREMVETVAHPLAGPIRVLGIPTKLSDTPGAVRTPPPVLGEHTTAVLESDLGLSRAEIDRLVNAGAIGRSAAAD